MSIVTEHFPQATPPVLQLRTREAVEQEIQRRVEAERVRLQNASTSQREIRHFQRPVELPFTAADRDKVTILFGGLTWKHEWLIRSVFRSAGYKTETLPTPDVASFQLGKEFGNNGQCNPTYFTVGHLIKYLQRLETTGLTPQQIVDQYAFVTAGSCGPCRFGMYEAEYRLAVENAGYAGFRILVLQQNEGVNASAPAPGLDFTTDFRVGILKAINIGDVVNDLLYQIRPFEVQAGRTDEVFTQVLENLSSSMARHEAFKLLDRLPIALGRRIARRETLRDVVDTFGVIYDQFYASRTLEALRNAGERINEIDVDRLRVRPVVKITGEFFAQTTEGDGNFNMFRFLEREGAQVLVEPVANWILYLIWCGKADHAARKRIGTSGLRPWELHKRAAREASFYTNQLLYTFGERFYAHLYGRLVYALGGAGHRLLNMDELAAIARPYYNRYARGGEGHLEVAKNIYYSVNKKCHLVLSLKPFGCMPSTQSDGVQSAVMSHFKDMLFLPIETSGEGEINAHSRVQMALGEAKAKAKGEFQQALESTGKQIEDIRAFVEAHPFLKRPFYQVPHRHGIAGTAAAFVLHVSDLMDDPARLREARRSAAHQ
jgi:predicted nucleotide-binding protein (sugar kinase/HSP70/actin superfamily)